MRLWLALQTFYGVLFSRDFAAGVKQLQLGGPALAARESEPTAKADKPTPPMPPARSDAITLLATLQREARFVDIVTESLDAYSDEQIGAAARDVLRDSGKVIARMFALQPVVAEAEGDAVQVPQDYDAGRYRLTGNVAGNPPLAGKVMHAGWQATKCELPKWTGTPESAKVVAPAEVHVN